MSGGEQVIIVKSLNCQGTGNEGKTMFSFIPTW